MASVEQLKHIFESSDMDGDGFIRYALRSKEDLQRSSGLSHEEVTSLFDMLKQGSTSDQSLSFDEFCAALHCTAAEIPADSLQRSLHYFRRALNLPASQITPLEELERVACCLQQTVSSKELGAGLAAALTYLKEKLELFDASTSELEGKCKDSQLASSIAAEQSSAMRASNEKLVEEMENLERSHRRLETQFAEARTEIAWLKHQLAQRQGDAQAEVEAQQQVVAKLQHALESYTCNALAKTVQQLEVQNVGKLGAGPATTQRLCEEHADEAAALVQELTSLKRANSKLGSECTAYRIENQRLLLKLNEERLRAKALTPISSPSSCKQTLFDEFKSFESVTRSDETISFQTVGVQCKISKKQKRDCNLFFFW